MWVVGELIRPDVLIPLAVLCLPDKPGVTGLTDALHQRLGVGRLLRAGFRPELPPIARPDVGPGRDRMQPTGLGGHRATVTSAQHGRVGDRRKRHCRYR